MVDIQSATAEIRRGEKRRKKIETTGQKYDGLPYSRGSPYGIGQTIIFMVALCNRADHIYLWSPYVIGQKIIFSSCFYFILLLFFSSPKLSG